MKYYLDDNGGLWKKNETDDFYFSRKSLKWIKSHIAFIVGDFEYNNEIPEKAALIILKDYQKNGIIELVNRRLKVTFSYHIEIEENY
jgi:hypothetical protein